MTPDEFCRPNGPGIKSQLRYYKTYLKGLEKRAKQGDKLAQKDLEHNDITRSIIADYEAGKIDAYSRFDMMKEWRRIVWAAIELRNPVSLAAKEHGIDLPPGYVEEKNQFVFKS